MDIMPVAVAALAAGAILLIVIGLTSNAPIDPVQARLTQLGTMQAKNLEELTGWSHTDVAGRMAMTGQELK